MGQRGERGSGKVDRDLGRRIRDRRLEVGLSQLELARLVGWDKHQYVEKIENGKRAVNASELGKIAAGLDTSADVLLGGAAGQRRVPLFGDVGVGGVYYPDARVGRWVEVTKIKAPLGEESVDACLRVVGAHLEAFGYRDGDLLFFRYGGEPLEEVVGRRCVVQIRSGEAIVGVITGRLPGDKVSFRPLSDSEPVRDVSVDWAARIRWCQYA